jgi:hypothetical protein
MSHHKARLGVVAVGFALGITWAIGLLVMGWASELSGGWGKPFIDAMGTVYLGYQPTFWGTVIGAVWGLVDGFISGIIFAAIYNACVCSKGCNHENHAAGM